MGSFSQSFLSSSPVVVLAQQLPPRSFEAHHSFSSSTFGQAPSTTWSQPQLQSPSQTTATNGRKRSRDAAADNLEDDTAYFPPTLAPTQESEEGWEWGEGMTLIKPHGFIIDASSQTGTWADEKVSTSKESTPPASQDRPTPRSFKSQRLDFTATPAIAEETSVANGLSLASSPQVSGQEGPIVDDFTIHLGIGWSRISNDEHILAAARGWAKYIENHYPITDVHIRLQSKGLASYLVESREGWFLFAEDLKEGRLVSTSLERTVQNLRTSPPVFDGFETMVAAVSTPRIDEDAGQDMGVSEFHGPSQKVLRDGSVAGAHSEQIMMNASRARSPARREIEVDMDMDIS